MSYLFPITGLSGPRGRSGKPGTNGVPGIPGITGYQYRVNGTKSSDLLIPPSIVGMNENDFLRPIVVQEGENLRLRCAATGTPRPEILWRRLDNRPISYGKWDGKRGADVPFAAAVISLMHVSNHLANILKQIQRWSDTPSTLRTFSGHTWEFISAVRIMGFPLPPMQPLMWRSNVSSPHRFVQ